MVKQFKFLLNLIIIIIGFYIFLNGYKIIDNNKKNSYEISDLIDTKVQKNIDEFEDSKSVIEENIIIKDQENIKKNKTKNIIDYKEITYKIEKNKTFIEILDKFFSSDKLKYSIINKIEEIYDLRKIRTNQLIYFYKNEENQIKKIKIPIEKTINLNVLLNETIIVEKQNLKSKIETEAREYLINDSLYSDGIKNNIPADILTKLIKLYSFDLDFQRDIRSNTQVSVSFESIIIEDRKEIFFGDIIYSFIKINKNILEYYKFRTDDGYIDYFNKKGENVKKSIIKTPLDGARLSSSFGMRKHPILGYNKMHKGVDFAAPTGTPVYAGGNGVIEFAGYNGGYGKFIKIRHNNEYKTAYAHLSKFKKGISKGVRVNQGDIIGYVGSTGRSTGPHLHYEIIFQNKQINPLKLKLPSGKKLKGNELNRFTKEANTIYANHLNLLYE